MAEEELTEMFGLFGILAKSISDQIAAQADIARRAATEWREAMMTLQPIRIETVSTRERQLRRLAMQRAASRRY